jgi:hypothetical protein
MGYNSGYNSGGGGSGGGGVPPTTQINTTLPLSGGGDLSANRTLVLTTAGVPTQTPVGTDLILFESGGAWAKNTLQNVLNAFQKIEFYANLGSFPPAGVVDVLYVDKASQALYLWTGAVYNKLTPNNVFTLLGNYNALTNTPNLVDGVGTVGDTYIVSVGGVRNFGSGNIDLNPSDKVYYANGVWNKEDNTDAVFSVNGLQGIVVLTTTNIAEGTNLYFTTARVLATLLVGFVVGSNSAILATDSVLQAFGKTQGQINDLNTKTSKVIFLDETSTIADIQANKLHIYVGNAPLTIDLDVAIPFPPLPIPTQQNFSVSNNSGFAFAIISSGGGSVLSLPARYSYASGITITDGGGGYWEANPANYVTYPTLQQVLSAGNISQNVEARFQNNPVTQETRFYYDGFFAEDFLADSVLWYNSRFIRKSSSGSKTFFINMPNLAANAALSSFSANFRPNVTGTVAYLSDIVTAALANILQNGNTLAANIVIGTNDNFSLSFETNAIIRATISNGGVFNIANLTSLGNRLIQANSSGDLQLTTIDPADISLLSTLTENVQDIVGAFVAGTANNISTVYTDGSNTFVIDLISTAVTANAYGSATQIPTFTVDAKGRLTLATNVNIAIPSTQITDFTEAVQDVVGAFSIAGAGITITYNDPANTLTIASSITQYTDEQAQDAVGNAFVNSLNIAFTYNDPANTITADLTNTTVTAAVYGSATQIPVTTVDAKGRITGVTNTAIAIPSTQITNFVEASQDAIGVALLDTNSIDFTYNDVANTITADFKVSPNAGNALSILGNGGYVANVSDGTQIITATNTTTNVDLSLISSGKFEIVMSSLTLNTSIVVTNPVNGRDYSFLFRGNTNKNVTFPASFVWDDGLAFDGFSSSSPSNKVIFTYYSSILQYIVKR